MATIDVANRLSPALIFPLKSGPGTAGGEVDHPELGIHRRRLPHGRAAVQPRLVVLWPRVVTDLPRARNRVERPDQAAVFRVVRLDAPARAVFAAGKADDHHPVVIEGRGGNRVAVLPALRLDGPRGFARSLVERDQPAVQLPDVHLAVAERDAATRPSAADRGDGVGQRRLVAPDDAARLHAEREHIVGAGDDVDHAVVNDRLRLAGIFGRDAGPVEMRPPDAFDAGDGVSIDLRERRVVLVEQVPAVLQPVCAWQRRQFPGGEGGACGRGGGLLRLGAAPAATRTATNIAECLRMETSSARESATRAGPASSRRERPTPNAQLPSPWIGNWKLGIGSCYGVSSRAHGALNSIGSPVSSRPLNRVCA